MNVQSNICIGCLSDDRKLHVLNEERKQAFSGLLEISYHAPMLVCFECSALLLRLMNFKKQLPKSLSKLNITSNENIFYESRETDKLANSEDIKFEDVDQKSDQDANIDQYASYDQRIGDQKISMEPMAFVKVEDMDDADHDRSSPDHKETFTDSDDEPLNVKSKFKDRKITKNKKNESLKRKKGNTSGIATDPRVAKKLKELNIEEGQLSLVLLSWEEVEEERRLALQSPRFARQSYRCDKCIVGFNHSHKLIQHNLKHQIEAGDEICDICTIRCKTRAALSSHKRRHRARWRCVECGAGFSAAGVAADHCARVHHATVTHRCHRCAYVATSLGALRAHIKSHSSRPECELCGKTFRDKSSLRTHAFVHKGEKEHACSVCDKRFMFKKQKEIHEVIHKEHQHLYCYQCDVSFKNQTSFYQHMKYNLKHIDPADIKHACQLCDKKFVKAKRLEEHNLAVHLKLAPIKCTEENCTFACPSRAALRSHNRLVHRGANAIRNHVCHLCGHTYKSKKSLDCHLRTHNTIVSLTHTTNVDTS